jgi:hypothetical protein
MVRHLRQGHARAPKELQLLSPAVPRGSGREPAPKQAPLNSQHRERERERQTRSQPHSQPQTYRHTHTHTHTHTSHTCDWHKHLLRHTAQPSSSSLGQAQQFPQLSSVLASSKVCRVSDCVCVCRRIHYSSDPVQVQSMLAASTQSQSNCLSKLKRHSSFSISTCTCPSALLTRSNKPRGLQAIIGPSQDPTTWSMALHFS